MKEEKEIRVVILGTSRCDTGCSHCSFNSGKEGKDLSLSAIRSLKKSIEKFDGMATITFTGGGEPLMWSHLPKAISILKKLPNVRFSMVTSGCLGENDPRFDVLKEAFKVEKKILVTHSFNSFSSSFPKRLAFTLPHILLKGKYEATFVNLVAGFSQDEKDKDTYHIYIPEVIRIFERVLKEAVGYCSRWLYFEDRNLLTAKKAGQYLNEGLDPLGLEEWLRQKAFSEPTVYVPYALGFSYRKIIMHGSTCSTMGRAQKFSSPDMGSYNYRLGFCCGAYNDTLDLSPQGKFVFCCHKPNFPPIFLGEPGDDLEKMVKEKKNLFSKDLNLRRVEISGIRSLHDPCVNCLDKAWEFFLNK